MNQKSMTILAPLATLSAAAQNVSDINFGTLSFRAAPEGRGTEVTISFNETASPELISGGYESLRRLKQFVEAGEITTSAMRPADQPAALAGRRS